MSEIDAQKCEACDEVILTDHEEHYTDDFGLIWHHWCVDEVSKDEADDLAEELAIEEAREDGRL